MPDRLTGRVLLIGWDAADWAVIRPLVERGQMPNTARLMSEGVSGNLASIQPMLSPMLWTSIATGKRPHKHGIHGFTEPRPDGEGIRAVASTSRTTKALWNICTQSGLRAHCINWYASHPAEPINGVCVSNRFNIAPAAPGAPWPVTGGTVHPPELAETLASLRRRPEEMDASLLLPFVPQAARIDQARDKRLLALAVIVAETANTHAAITWSLEHRPWDVASVLYNGIDQFCHLFMDYHPPRLEHVSADDFEIYGNVITAAYVFHDMMLGRLLELAGDDATVIIVSDHGYRTGAQRLRAKGKTLEGLSMEHRPQGVCLMRGPHVRRGEQLAGASLLDVTPTILTLLGLPLGGDMEGRPWVEALDRPVELDRIISWDQAPGEAGLHPPEQRESPAESLEAIRHLIELGYVEPPDEDVRGAIDRALEENGFNLARALLDARQPTRAIELLEALARQRPRSVPYQKALFEAYYTVGRNTDARRIAQAMWDFGYRGPLVNIALGALDLSARDAGSALERLREAERVNPDLPGLFALIGQAYARLRQWEDAERAFRRALAADADDAAAINGLAAVALATGRHEEGAELALRAIGVRADLPLGHYHLGVALTLLGRPQEAETAFRRALSIQPTLVAAMGRLAELYEGPLLDQRRARECRRQAREVMLQRRIRRRAAAAAPAQAPRAAPAASAPWFE